MYTGTTDHLHSASCLSVSTELVQEAKERAPPVQVAEGDTTTCASKLYIY